MTPARVDELIVEFKSLLRDVESLGGIRHAMQIVRYTDTIAALKRLKELELGRDENRKLNAELRELTSGGIPQ